MKRGYYRSRSKSLERRKSRHSPSRSREKQNKKSSNSHGGNGSRENSFRLGHAKVESDIKNHFRFKLPNLSGKEEEDSVIMLKSKLNQHIGPVQHITRSRQSMNFNLGFKYDIDALSFLQTGGLTIKTMSHKIHLDPIPTKVFEYIMNENSEDTEERKRSSSRRKKSRSRSNSMSSSQSSRHKKKNYRSESRDRITYIRVQIYGLPIYITQEKAVALISQAPGGPYKITRSGWRRVPESSCEYLQVRLDAQKADKLLEMCSKIQVDGRAVVAIEENQRPTKQLLNFQIQIQFPKAVHPSKVLRYLQCHGRVVQIVANQQIQQDGKSKGYLLTFNDRAIVDSLRRLGDLSNGIRVSQPKHGHYVYRPIHMLPTRYQL